MGNLDDLRLVQQFNAGRERINLNGAFCIEDHRLFIHVVETINAQSTVGLLKDILKNQPLEFI